MRHDIFAAILMSFLLVPAVEAFAGAPRCEMSAEAVIRYEKQILKSVNDQEEGSVPPLSAFEKPLFCLLKIQMDSGGFLKPLSEQVLKHLLGGPQIKGLADDPSYRKVTHLIREWALRHRVNGSLLEAHAEGSWDFYRQFCGEGRLASCREFIPDADSIQAQSSVLGASSLMMLKVAYLSLSGEDQEYVAQRIKSLYTSGKMKDPLKQKVLRQIYQDLFKKTNRLS